MRALHCRCRRHLEAQDDRALFTALREHLAAEHLGRSRVETPADELATAIFGGCVYELEYVAVPEDHELVPEPYSGPHGRRKRIGLEEEYAMRAEQTVSEMVAEALARQAEELADRTGQLLEEAFAQVLETPAGRQLAELADGPHRHEKAAEWQANLLAKREARRPAHLSELDSARDRCLGEAQPYAPECVEEGVFYEVHTGLRDVASFVVRRSEACRST